MSTAPYCTLANTGFNLHRDTLLHFAPCSSRARTTATWPFRAAVHNGVSLFLFDLLTSAPFSYGRVVQRIY